MWSNPLWKIKAQVRLYWTKTLSSNRLARRWCHGLWSTLQSGNHIKLQRDHWARKKWIWITRWRKMPAVYFKQWISCCPNWPPSNSIHKWYKNLTLPSSKHGPRPSAKVLKQAVGKNPTSFPIRWHKLPQLPIHHCRTLNTPLPIILMFMDWLQA